MNKIIKNQLAQVNMKLEYDDNTLTLFIPKTIKILPENMVPGRVYNIKVSDSIIHPTSNSTLASNWNGGKSPTAKNYYAEYLNKMSTMYKFNCTAVGDPSNDFFGWLPKEGFEIIEEL